MIQWDGSPESPVPSRQPGYFRARLNADKWNNSDYFVTMTNAPNENDKTIEPTDKSESAENLFNETLKRMLKSPPKPAGKDKSKGKPVATPKRKVADS